MRALRERQHVLAAEPHLAGRRLDQPQDAAAGRRLAAARFADQAERFSLLDREADVVDGAHDRRAGANSPRVAREVLDEVADFEQRHQVRRRGSASDLRHPDRGLVQIALAPSARRRTAVVAAAAPSCTARSDPGTAA